MLEGITASAFACACVRLLLPGRRRASSARIGLRSALHMAFVPKPEIHVAQRAVRA